MGMDRRLRPGSKPLRNQCRGTGVHPQVYTSEKTFKKKVARGRGRRAGGGGNKLQSFISIITIKNCHSAWYWFLIYKRKQRERKTNVVN